MRSILEKLFCNWQQCANYRYERTRETNSTSLEPKPYKAYAVLCCRHSSGPVAQLGARFHGMEEVESSNLSRSTNLATLRLA